MINLSKPIIGKEEIDAVNGVLESGMLVQGPKTLELENEFAKYCGAKFAVALNSGTAAIHAGLYGLRIGRGDEVITSPFTFVASANPIIMQGAKVVFADICEDDFNIDPKEIEKKITNRTKAILPIDLYGQIYDYQKVKEITDKYNLKILEDACQAIGARQGSKMAGTCGDVGAFSLYATKNIMSGEGGVLVTDNGDIAELAMRFRHHGQSQKTHYEYWDLGYNYRTTDLCASIAVEQLKKVDIFNDKRIENSKKLKEGLAGIAGLVLPTVKEGNKHVFHQFTVRITNDFYSSRESLVDYLKNNGIGCGVYYPKPLHLHPHFKKMGYNEGDFPVAERMAKSVLSLPVHPSLSSDDLEFIINTIRNYDGK